MGYFESLALQGFQNNLPSRVRDSFAIKHSVCSNQTLGIHYLKHWGEMLV